jgi:hypothetical protein
MNEQASMGDCLHDHDFNSTSRIGAKIGSDNGSRKGKEFHCGMEIIVIASHE